MLGHLTTPLESVFNFIVYDLPNLVISFLNIFFSPIKDLVGSGIYSAIKKFLVGVWPGPVEDIIWSIFFEPIFSLGFAGLFSITGLILILVLKLIDLFIPV